MYTSGVCNSLCVSFPGVLADVRLLLPHHRHLQSLGADRDVLVALSCAWRIELCMALRCGTENDK